MGILQAGRHSIRSGLTVLFGALLALASTSAFAADLLHNSVDTNSTKWGGKWGVAGGRYGQFTCATCHEPDADNLKNIRSVISVMNPTSSHFWPNGQKSITVSFTNQTSMGLDYGGHATSNRICEVCHSQNRFHNFNTANNTEGTNHPTPKQTCTNCHIHSTGFKAACGGCHGNPPSTPAIGGDYGLIGTPRASNALQPGQAGAHTTHTSRGMVCDECHYVNNGGIEMPNASGTIQLGFYGFGGKVTSGTYTPYTSATRGYRIVSGTPNTTIASAVTSYTNANKCSNVYCHGGGSIANGKPALTGGANQSPRWDTTGQNACGNCHGTTAANPPTLGSHLKHAGSASGYSYDCDLCHPKPTDNSHVLGTVRWRLQTADPRIGPAATYRDHDADATGDLAPSAIYGQCSNIACHSDGKGGAGNIIAPTWGDGTSFIGCNGCHGNAMTLASGRHAQHVNQNALLGSSYGCIDCHGNTVSNNTTISVRTNHVNQFLDYSGAKAGKGSSYTPANGVCAATYCHTDGKGTQKMTVAAGWNSGATLDCSGCHGSDSAPDFVSVAGEPNYASTGANQPRSNSHKKHVGTANQAATCIYCHATTVTSAGTAIVANHTNRTIDISAGGGKSFTPGANKTCASISCHGAGSATATWGATFPADCSGCHGSRATLSTGKHQQHVNQASLLGANYGCVDCHALTVSSDLSISNASRHADGFKDFSGVRAGKSSTYEPGTGVCSASYCHTDGKGSQKMVAANNWNTGAALDCMGCHGADVAPDFTSAAGEPNYVSEGAGLTRANSHKKHVGTTGQASTCVFCHSTTVDAAGTALIGSHTDRTINLAAGGGKSFIPGTGKTCSNISCHGVGSADATWGATFPADCSGCHGGNSTSGTQIITGQHSKHVSNSTVLGDNIGCASCHSATVSADRTVSAASNHGDGFVNFTGLYSGKNKTACAAAYCHSDGKGTNGVSVSWTSGPALGCTGCHGNDPAPDFASLAGEPNYANAGAGLFKANSHRAHAAAGASTCDTCHTATVISDGTALKSGNAHINNAINVDFNRTKEATATWNGLARTCSNITCHSNGNATWGDPSSAGCRVCHGSLTGAHAAHIGDLISNSLVTFYNFTANRSVGTNYRFGCANCHPTTLASHRNGTVDVTMNKNKAGGSILNAKNNLNTTDSAGYTKGGPTDLTCETVYCHSNGRTDTLAVGDYRQSPNWYGGTFAANRCGGCHDNPPQYAGQSHYNGASAIGNDGKSPARETGHMLNIHARNTYVGNKGNGFLGFSSSGNKAHGNAAVATTLACYVCHSGIVSSTQIDTYSMEGTGSDFRCSSCHTPSTRTIKQPGSIVNAGLHVNGSKNVAFAPINFKTKAQLSNVANAQGWTRNGNYKTADSFDSYDLSTSTWNAQTKTCMTACHVLQPNIIWGAQLKCVSCHANQ